ncbi:hypothetical protein AXX17_AT4G02640 [Arabidopsis thaliana]|uniref:Uncharacterized protein n=1 Tax=Arabidopsis thaliana TaxID=3702 RepID=A0A178V192_ARATH|nr:hypothetical protein AXX17_AT4G02640 [Arabidopsis thaliana]
MKKKKKVSSKFHVLVQAPLSSHIETAYNVGVMKKETQLVKSVFRCIKMDIQQFQNNRN